MPSGQGWCCDRCKGGSCVVTPCSGDDCLCAARPVHHGHLSDEDYAAKMEWVKDHSLSGDEVKRIVETALLEDKFSKS